MTRPVPIIVLVLLMASGMAGSVPDGGGADDGTSSTEDRSPQIFIVDDSGGVAFSTIQSAIDAASHGDFIRVYAGYYRENITIDKGVHLIGNDTYTWISNDGTRDVVTVLASPFTIKGFNIASQSKYSSIKLYYVDTGLIENCHISGSGIINGNGIRGDDGCNNITIINNIFDQDGDQAILLGGDGNRIEANSFYLNHIGVSIHGNDNRIVNNTFEESEYGVRLGHFSQDVLLMGNSYTNANNLARLVEGQLDKIATDAVATPLTGGGLTLSDHATRAQTSGHQWNVTLNNGRSWEAVILQDQSQIPGFPTTGLYWQQSMAAARVLDAMIEDRYADTVLLMTWGRRDGDPTNPG
ncbi:MAG: right-handed parallel beta-helix repeat-containing protein, partial [Thermoplasmata archaeon]|nr:right-handed parallel beta-helix repeat-containing protein [Thermoplasmata archaeon]